MTGQWSQWSREASYSLVALHVFRYILYSLYANVQVKCLKGLAPDYLVAFCTKGSAVSGRSALRSPVVGILWCLAQGGLGFDSLCHCWSQLLEWIACCIEGWS